MPPRLWYSIGLAAVAFIGLTACGDPFGAVSSDPVPASAKVDELLVALTARFTNLDRSGRFEVARQRLILSALTPTKLFGDTSLWTSRSSPTSRTLLARGRLVDNGYHFEVTPAGTVPLSIGDTRHAIALTKIRDNEFRWETAVDFAVGPITAGDLAGAFRAMLALPEGHSTAEVRAAGHRLFPATATALSRAIVIDSLDVRPGAQQSTSVYLRLAVLTDRLRATYPAFAGYLAKYTQKSRSHFVLRDAVGRTYFDLEGGQEQWIVRYRLLNGALVSALGAPHPMPDTLELVSDVTLRTKLFTVGFRNLHTQFLIDSGAHIRGWTVTGHQEPEWILPMLTERLIGGSLRRPFQGTGAMFQIGIRDSARTPTLLVRHARLEVQEGTIMRLLNGIVAKMFNDLDIQVEREESAFIHDMLVAFRQDTRALPFLKKGSATGP